MARSQLASSMSGSSKRTPIGSIEPVVVGYNASDDPGYWVRLGRRGIDQFPVSIRAMFARIATIHRHRSGAYPVGTGTHCPVSSTGSRSTLATNEG